MARQPQKSEDPQAGFFKVELALCFTFADVAETNFKSGNLAAAKSAMGKAQIGLETIQGYLKDPKHSRHLTREELQETKDESKRLQARLKSLEAKNPRATT